MKSCQLGKTAKAEMIVSPRDTAAAVGSGLLEVFSTPRMIALMEQAACLAVENILEEGESSVGIAISAEHLAATPVGLRVTAEATVSACEGRIIDFTITVSDEKEPIDTARHKRAVIKADRFMQKANAKK